MSLLHGLRDDRFRLLTLDSFYGNLVIGSAFGDARGRENPAASQGFSDAAISRIAQRSRYYLDRSLRAAARRCITPILSAECAGMFEDASMQRLQTFLAERGWSPQVIAYVRAPLDLIESGFQQLVKIGDRVVLLPSFRSFLCGHDYHEKFVRLDRVFGSSAVTLHWFDPDTFPGHCVVRHFCESAGIPFRAEDVIRVNESINLNVIRFLYAMIISGHASGRSVMDRVKRRLILERLAGLSGPPLRLHRTLTADYMEKVHRGWGGLERRLGRSAPMTLHSRSPNEGVGSEEDLLAFSGESLEWLAQTTGRRVVRRGRGLDTVGRVVEQLHAICFLNSSACLRRLACDTARERWQRNRLWWQNQQ